MKWAPIRLSRLTPAITTSGTYYILAAANVWVGFGDTVTCTVNDLNGYAETFNSQLIADGVISLSGVGYLFATEELLLECSSVNGTSTFQNGGVNAILMAPPVRTGRSDLSPIERLQS